MLLLVCGSRDDVDDVRDRGDVADKLAVRGCVVDAVATGTVAATAAAADDDGDDENDVDIPDVDIPDVDRGTEFTVAVIGNEEAGAAAAAEVSEELVKAIGWENDEVGSVDCCCCCCCGSGGCCGCTAGREDLSSRIALNSYG